MTQMTPWMTVRDTLDYFASFRVRWNQQTERALLDQFRLDLRQILLPMAAWERSLSFRSRLSGSELRHTPQRGGWPAA